MNNTNTNLNTGAVSNSQSSNFVKLRLANLYVQSDKHGNADNFGEQPPGLVPEWLRRRRDGDGDRRFGPPRNTRSPTSSPMSAEARRRRHLSARQSSEMLAFFNVGRTSARRRRRVDDVPPISSEVWTCGCLRLRAEHSARRLCQSVEFCCAGGCDIQQRRQYARSRRAMTTMSLSETGGYANQQMVTAESVGANTSTFLTSISSAPVTPCACKSTKWGFWSAFNGAKDSERQSRIRGSGQSFALGRRRAAHVWRHLPTTGTATYTGHAIANIANPNNITSYLAAGTFSAWSIRNSQWRSDDQRPRRNELHRHGHMDSVDDSFNGTLAGDVGSRTATIARLDSSRADQTA